jgi:hypothetical protein
MAFLPETGSSFLRHRRFCDWLFCFVWPVFKGCVGKSTRGTESGRIAGSPVAATRAFSSSRFEEARTDARLYETPKAEADSRSNVRLGQKQVLPTSMSTLCRKDGSRRRPTDERVFISVTDLMLRRGT